LKNENRLRKDNHYRGYGSEFSGFYRICASSLLWALGSMLGATKSVDMMCSLRNDFARVEVAVLNIDLLPNNTDTIVIGDRLFSLPIQVEGREDEAAYDCQMEVDDGNNWG
jgi:hypothetical protein